jgi:hypothetical protein
MAMAYDQVDVDDQGLQERCLFAPFWYVDEATDSLIEVKNNLTEEVTVRVFLRTEDGQALTPPELVLAPLGWASISIRSQLPAEVLSGKGAPSASWGDGSRPASVVGSAYLLPVGPDHGAGTVSGWIRIEDPSERLGIVATFETLTYPVTPTALHSTWWLPFPGCKAYFALQNASVVPLELAVDFVAETFSGSTTLALPPLGSTTLDLAQFLGRDRIPHTGGITFRVEHGDPGDVGLNRLVGRGRVVQERIGFATSLRLHEANPAASSSPGGEIHAPVAYFGHLSRLLARSAMVLHPHVLLRNVGAQPMTVAIAA